MDGRRDGETYAEETVHANDAAAKDEAQHDESEEVVAVELQEHGIHGSRADEESAGFGEKAFHL